MKRLAILGSSNDNGFHLNIKYKGGVCTNFETPQITEHKNSLNAKSEKAKEIIELKPLTTKAFIISFLLYSFNLVIFLSARDMLPDFYYFTLFLLTTGIYYLSINNPVAIKNFFISRLSLENSKWHACEHKLANILEKNKAITPQITELVKSDSYSANCGSNKLLERFLLSISIPINFTLLYLIIVINPPINNYQATLLFFLLLLDSLILIVALFRVKLFFNLNQKRFLAEPDSWHYQETLMLWKKILLYEIV